LLTQINHDRSIHEGNQEHQARAFWTDAAAQTKYDDTAIFRNNFDGDARKMRTRTATPTMVQIKTILDLSFSSSERIKQNQLFFM